MVLCCTVDFEQIERIAIINYALNIVIQKRKLNNNGNRAS